MVAARHGLPAPEEFWGPDQDYLKLRIQTELFSLVFGLDVGEQLETRSDPQIQRAVELFPKINALLKPRAPDLAVAPK
jgi:hypothetical protein